MQKDVGIYQITCRPNGKIYIGSSIHLVKRIRSHKSDLRNNKHPNARLQNAWNKYEECNFVFEILLNCSVESVFDFEQTFIDQFASARTGFNIADCAKNPRLGAKYTEQEKLNMSVALTGRRLTDAHRLNISHGGLGVKRSEETRQKMRESAALRPQSRYDKVKQTLTGKPKSESHKAKTGAATRLRCQDPVYLQKLSEAQKSSHTPEYLAALLARNSERMKDPEIRKKISQALTGRKASVETKAKLSAAHKGKKLSDAQKALLSQLAKERWAAKKLAQQII